MVVAAYGDEVQIKIVPILISYSAHLESLCSSWSLYFRIVILGKLASILWTLGMVSMAARSSKYG